MRSGLIVWGEMAICVYDLNLTHCRLIKEGSGSDEKIYFGQTTSRGGGRDFEPCIGEKNILSYFFLTMNYL